MKSSFIPIALNTALICLLGTVSCFAQQQTGVANSISQNELYGWLDFRPEKADAVGLHLHRGDGTSSLHLALIETDGTFVSVGESLFVWGSFTQFEIEIFDLNSGDTAALVELIVVVDTGDLGDSWTPLDIEDEDNWTGCEGVATDIKNTLGGSAEIKVIKPKTDGLKLGEYRDVGTGWYEHHVVIKNGKVYDGFGPRTGLSIKEYKELWKPKDDINFGF